jgi:LuxR family transcriptional regulator, maltose regulon positive regulatory protein
VSVNTVKAHLKHIYRKLDVDTRRQAANRARQLGLLLEPGGSNRP